MSFQHIAQVGDPDFYIDLAFKRANKKAQEARFEKVKGTRLDKSRRIETAKIKEINRILMRQMDLIIKSFPSFDDLPEFYKELIKTFTNYEKLKKSLGAVNWVKKKISEFDTIYARKIKGTIDMNLINKHRVDYYGRISSLLKRIKKELKALEDARKILKGFPHIKTKLFTVAIVGFPNVGKTTLLSKLSLSKPDIQDYAFTTKGVNVGYMKAGNDKIQLLDTPGTLNRFNKMNAIEKQAHLAVKYCTNLLVYVFDPTGTYPINQQEELLEVFKGFDLPMLFYISKDDMETAKDTAAELKKKYKSLSLSDIRKEIIRRKAIVR